MRFENHCYRLRILIIKYINTWSYLIQPQSIWVTQCFFSLSLLSLSLCSNVTSGRCSSSETEPLCWEVSGTGWSSTCWFPPFKNFLSSLPWKAQIWELERPVWITHLVEWEWPWTSWWTWCSSYGWEQWYLAQRVLLSLGFPWTRSPAGWGLRPGGLGPSSSDSTGEERSGSSLNWVLFSKISATSKGRPLHNSVPPVISFDSKSTWLSRAWLSHKGLFSSSLGQVRGREHNKPWSSQV